MKASASAEFMVNGIKVAEGLNASLSNLPAGSYELIAVSENSVSEKIHFSVVEKASSDIYFTQSGSSISASLDSVSGFEKVARVSYMLDGKEVGKATSNPYSVTISNVTPENHMLEAVAYDAAGIVVTKVSKEICPALSDNITKAYSNEVSYTVSGSGSVDVKNGNHQLLLTHNESTVSYQTTSGKKSYKIGNGTFKVLTDGPYAEVYHNGQYIFGFIMPKTAEVGTVFDGDVSNGSVSIPAERMSYFSARNVNVQNGVYQLADLTSEHNLDFVADPTDEVRLVLNDGFYRNDITIKGGAIYVWDAERNNSLATQKKVEYKMKSNGVYYRVETSAGMSRLYADGKWIHTFRNGQVAGDAGTLSVNVTGGDGLAYLGVNSNHDLYFYEDSFDGTGKYDSIDYWQTKDLTATISDGAMVLNASGKENAIASLSASCGEFDLSAKVRIDSFDSSKAGGLWFMMNNPTTGTYTKVGYYKNRSGSSKKYQIVDNASTSSKTSSKNGSISTGTTYQFDVKVRETSEGEKITFYVDGQEVLSQVGTYHHRGKVGFILSNCQATIEEFSYRGDAKPMLDVRDNPLDGTTTLDMIENGDKTYMVNMGGGFVTTDNGKTWEKFTPSKGAGLEATYGYGGMTENMVKLSNGQILSANRNAPSSWWDEYGQRRYVWNIYSSNDNGMNWSKISSAQFPGTGGEVDAEQSRSATVNRITQGPSGRVYLVSGGGNSEDYGNAEVWMSDNNGLNWFKSMTPIEALQTGYVIAEAVVIETNRNTRFYFRTDKGELCYYSSYDYGETWDVIPHTTPFVSSMTCFGIEADPDDPDTLYMGWGYDNINLYARAQFPRTRWAVAKSTDAGETWEMLGTVHENNSIEHNMMNLSLNVGKDYVYLNAFSSDTFGKTTPWTSRIVSFAKDKQSSTPRMEQLHSLYPTQVGNTMALSEEKENLALTIHPSSGNVTLRGQIIPNGTDGDYISLDAVAAFIGAELSVSDQKNVFFRIGDGSKELSSKSVKTISGKPYGKISAVADLLGMSVINVDETMIMSRNAEWSPRQKNALRYTTDLFTTNP